MCLGIPGRVVALTANPHLATVEVSGVERAINVGLLQEDGGVEPGEWVLIHVGFALNKLSTDEVQLALQSLQMMAEGQVDEIEAELPSRSPVGEQEQGQREREGPVWAS